MLFHVLETLFWSFRGKFQVCIHLSENIVFIGMIPVS